MVGKYRKKSVEVEALQWDVRNLDEIEGFVGCDVSVRVMGSVLYLYMDEKTYPMNRLDYIIKEPSGRVYPCSWETFQDFYEEVETEEAKVFTVQEFITQNPSFLKPILVGSVLGAIRSLCSDPSEASCFEEDVNQVITDMLSKPATEIFQQDKGC